MRAGSSEPRKLDSEISLEVDRLTGSSREQLSITKTTVCENDNLEMIGLCHVGMYAKNPASLAEFYREVMGMQIVDCSDASHPLSASAFLSSHPREDSHQIAMFSNPELAHRLSKLGHLPH